MAGRYKAYPEYKDSGIDWIKDIPLNWMVISLRHLISSIKNGSTETQIEKSAESVAISRIETISTGDLNMDKTGFVNPKFISESFKLKTGDLLLSHINSLSMVGNVAQVQAKHFIYHGMNLLRLVPKEGVLSRYLYWQLKSDYSRRLIESVAKPAINQASVSTESLKTLQMLCPSLVEQQKIANFLDHETAKIDNLIAKQEKLIELLKEKRQAVISHAVTKGLNPDVRMKDSGVEWLGEVPEHWNLKKFKYLFKIRKRIAGETGYDILSITQKGIKIKDITSGEGQLSMDYSKYQLVYRGDFAMNHMDLLTGFVDVSKYDGVTSPDYRVFTLEHKTSEPSYYLRLLQMGYLDKLFYPLGQGAAHIGRWRLPTEAFNEFLAPCPPYEEQKQIALFINKTYYKIDQLMDKATQAICLMKERKTALISAAVTGKIDVCDWQPKGIQE